jgi:hypothetical protein
MPQNRSKRHWVLYMLAQSNHIMCIIKAIPKRILINLFEWKRRRCIPTSQHVKQCRGQGLTDTPQKVATMLLQIPQEYLNRLTGQLFDPDASWLANPSRPLRSTPMPWVTY